MSRLQDKKSKNTCKWTDKIDDLWDEKYFKHLLDAATPYAELEPGFVYDPCEQKYGFEYWIHDESSISTMSPDEIFSENKYPSQEATVPMHAENIIKGKQIILVTNIYKTFGKAIEFKNYLHGGG